MEKLDKFFKSLSISQIIMILAPVSIVFSYQKFSNRDLKYFFPDLSLVSGIISYYVSIFLIDSTNKIKEQIKQHISSTIQLRSNIKKLKDNGESLTALLNDFKEIILKIEIDLLKLEIIDKELLHEYDKQRYHLATSLEEYKVSISQYSSTDFQFENYKSLLYKTKIDQIRRNRSKILLEMKSQTQRLIIEIALIPKLDEFK